MYSLVILPKKTQFAQGKIHKAQVTIEQVKTYPGIFLSLLHRDKEAVEAVFKAIAEDFKPRKKANLAITLAQDFFQSDEIFISPEESLAVIEENPAEISGCQTAMDAYGEGKAWRYVLAASLVDFLKEITLSFGFKLININSATEAIMNALRDLTGENFLLTFGEHNLHVEFANGLTGLNKFSLPLTEFPLEIKDWDIAQLQEDLNLHSKIKDTVFSHKIKSNLSIGQKIYSVNSETLAQHPGISNLELIEKLQREKALKSDLPPQDLSNYLLNIGSLLCCSETNSNYLITPPGFELNKLNFIDIPKEKQSKNRRNIHSSPVRRFCKAVFLLCLFASLFMGSSIYYFNRIKSPSNTEMAEYHNVLEENQTLKEKLQSYENSTGNGVYFNELIHQLHLDKLGTEEYKNLSLSSVTIDPVSAGDKDTTVELKLSGPEEEVANFGEYLKGNRYFKEAELKTSPAKDEDISSSGSSYTLILKAKAGNTTQEEDK